MKQHIYNAVYPDNINYSKPRVKRPHNDKW